MQYAIALSGTIWNKQGVPLEDVTLHKDEQGAVVRYETAVEASMAATSCEMRSKEGDWHLRAVKVYTDDSGVEMVMEVWMAGYAETVKSEPNEIIE